MCWTLEGQKGKFYNDCQKSVTQMSFYHSPWVLSTWYLLLEWIPEDSVTKFISCPDGFHAESKGFSFIHFPRYVCDTRRRVTRAAMRTWAPVHSAHRQPKYSLALSHQLWNCPQISQLIDLLGHTTTNSDFAIQWRVQKILVTNEKQQLKLKKGKN